MKILLIGLMKTNLLWMSLAHGCRILLQLIAD
nr:MAG TPA: hypothetical protein [Caudoviricetes sp.]